MRYFEIELIKIKFIKKYSPHYTQTNCLSSPAILDKITKFHLIRKFLFDKPKKRFDAASNLIFINFSSDIVILILACSPKILGDM